MKFREVSGDASETAILKCVESINGKVMAYRNKNPKICEIPFNSCNKYQVKGNQRAPDVPVSSKMQIRNCRCPFTFATKTPAPSTCW